MVQPGFSVGFAVMDLSYLVAAILFVIGLKMLSKPETARAGNLWAGVGMLLAMVTTLLLHRNPQGQLIPLQNALVVILVIAAGTVVGWILARKVHMTAMPQMVSFYNATGGAASGLVALMEYGNPDNTSLLVTLLGIAVGNIAFSGSMIAYGKLDGKIKDWISPAMKYINLVMLLANNGIDHSDYDSRN